MIEAQHSLGIDADTRQVWDYVRDIRRWADLFPGCQQCEVVDDHHSNWTIKVGAGGLVKTVDVQVHVENWQGPERVDFTFKLKNEPVTGRGAYTATPSGGATEVKLHLQVEGSGQMAPMWEAMCRPLLPQLAKTFAGRLKGRIEENTGESIPAAKTSWLAVLGRWLRRLFAPTDKTPRGDSRNERTK